ncbi:MAG: hypothetical protein IPP74_03980 [Alphaproteobacteria bacterium]|nr:hypothetical protein [Alphaproteobacteria bacterium]
MGPKKKRALLNHFGSIQSIADSTIEDLLQAKGIDRTAAEKVYQYFRIESFFGSDLPIYSILIMNKCIYLILI